MIIVDKQTGNARVAFLGANGSLTWSPAMPTGITPPDAIGIGRFLASDRDALAITSVEANRVYLVNLSTASASSNGAPKVVTQQGIGPYALAGLSSPYGQTIPYDSLAVASAYNPAQFGSYLVELYALGANGAATFQARIATDSYLATANSLKLGAGLTTYLGGIKRGSNDTFVALLFGGVSNVLTRANLAPGTEYCFGSFRWADGQLAPALLFYVPGESNITVQRVFPSGSGFDLQEPVTTPFASAIDRVYYIDEGTNGYGVVQFGDGAVGVRPTAEDQLQITAGLGLGPAGNVITGFVPLGPGRFVRLLGGSNTFASAQAEVFTKTGADYVQTSTSTIPGATSGGTRANIWLFSNEPFVTPNPTFVASLNGGDWVSSVSGLPGSVTAVTETDRGVTSGLGNATARSFSSPSLNSTYGLVNQYLPSVSLFSYSSPRAAEPVLITISPPPGHYDNAINISFSTANPSDRVFYKVNSGAFYQQYITPVLLGTNGTVEFYGTTVGGLRSSLQLASYTITARPALLNTNTVDGSSNPPPVITPTNDIAGYAWGTIIYGRRSGNTGSVWAIHLDGSGDRFLTEGARPRISPDGEMLAIAKEGLPFQNLGNLWLRDLSTGEERRIFANNDQMVYYDWDRVTGGLFYDYFCRLWHIDTNGSISFMPMTNDCNDDAPTQNPMTAGLAFHNLGQNPALRGIYISPPDGGTKQKLVLPATNPRFPAWSPDGQLLAFADGTTSIEGGVNLWVCKADGSNPHQITGFTSPNGFKYGAVWSPAGDALIGAGTVGNVNGIWIVPLTADRSACASPPVRLPTLPGDPIDFVGSAFTPPPPPQLLIRRDSDAVTVTWRLVAWWNLLQSTPEPGPTATWITVPPPYALTNGWFEYQIPNSSLQSSEFFRLKRP